MRIKTDFLKTDLFQRIVYASSIIAAVLTVSFGYLFFYPAFAFHIFLAVALIVAMTMPAILMTLEERRKSQIDKMLPRLLEDIAESQESGMTLLKAFETSSKRNYGPITKEMKHLVAQITWGVEFEKAFISFSKRIDTEMTTKITTLLLEAMKLGGDLKRTFNSTASFVREMIQLREERESQLKPYMMVIYISSFVFMLIIIILYQSFFLSIASGRKGGGFMSMPMSLESYKAVLFDLVVVEAFFGGITAGKLSGGSLKTGLKHSVILMAIVSVFFGLVFLDPMPPSIDLVWFAPSSPTYITHVDVMVEIKDPFPGSGVQTAYIIWTRDDWSTNRTVEMEYSMISEIWEVQIPPFPEGETILFLIKAIDSSGNIAINDNEQQFFSYIVSG